MTSNALPPDQAARLQALDITQSFLVQAPAGSGKTLSCAAGNRRRAGRDSRHHLYPRCYSGNAQSHSLAN
jgi:superfamily II DNA/RNA helicase